MTQFPKRIALLGSTGSIGQQTLDVVRSFPEHFRIVALAARSNVTLLAQQVQEFNPSLVACFADTPDRKSTRLNSSHDQISYAVFCLKKKKKNNRNIISDAESEQQARSYDEKT